MRSCTTEKEETAQPAEKTWLGNLHQAEAVHVYSCVYLHLRPMARSVGNGGRPRDAAKQQKAGQSRRQGDTGIGYACVHGFSCRWAVKER